MPRKPLLSQKNSLLRLKVSDEILMDAQQIAIGGYAPLNGFMVKADFASVLKRMRLANTDVWTLPIILDAEKKLTDSLHSGDELFLTDSRDNPGCLVMVEQVYEHDKSLHCRLVFGTEDMAHPGVARVRAMADMLIGGRVISVFQAPFSPLRRFMMTPEQTKEYFKKRNWKSITAFHTRNVVHRAHEYLQRCAMEYTDGILIHPVVGVTKVGDFKKRLVLRAYQRLIDSYYPQDKVLLTALGISMKFAGPRAAVFHALVRKNYGCTHIIIGRDHAGVGGYYEKYAAHKIFSQLPYLGIIPLLFKGPFYCKKCAGIVTENTCSHPLSYRLEISGTLARKFIKQKREIPHWLMRPEIADLLETMGERAFIKKL